MKIIVRKPNLNDLNENGIPGDFASIMEYFNYGISTQTGAFPFIPRRQPITVEEIRDRWMPNAEKNIGLVAELNGKVVGSIAAFQTPSTNYEHQSTRKLWDIGESVDPRENNYAEVLHTLYTGLTDELRSRGANARAVFPIEDVKSIAILRSFNFPEQEIEHPPYKAVNLSGKGIEFTIK
jgi:hypothetical protein